jgi:benzoyl-CoA reductase subunit C
VIRNLSGMWKVLFPNKYVRYIDVPQSFDPKVAGRFFRGELGRSRDDLAKLRGKPVTDDELHVSIARYNDNRRAISELFALRSRAPWRALALESYLVLFAGNVLPVEEHTALVRAYIAAALAAERPMRDNARVVTMGSFCEQPPLGLIRTLEMAGCYIVWDDLSLGKRWLTAEVSTEGDPLVALAEAFLSHSTSSAVLYEPRREKGDALMDIVRRTRAEGVLFCRAELLRSRPARSAHAGQGPRKGGHSLDGVQVLREPRAVPGHPRAGRHLRRFHQALEA